MFDQYTALEKYLINKFHYSLIFLSLSLSLTHTHTQLLIELTFLFFDKSTYLLEKHFFALFCRFFLLPLFLFVSSYISFLFLLFVSRPVFFNLFVVAEPLMTSKNVTEHQLTLSKLILSNHKQAKNCHFLSSDL
jgi:hypothetical protein